VPSPTAGPALVWLYRHGPILLSASEVCLGWTDAPLADAARTAEEARRLGRLIGSVDAVYSSDLQRATGTGAPLAETLGLPLRVIPALREMRFGQWEGRRWADLREEASEFFAHYVNHWETAAAPGGESFADLRARVAGFWDQLVRDHDGGAVALVSHGVALAALSANLLGWPARRAMKHMLDRGRFGLIDRRRDALAWNFDPARL
jgi:broad specificity phosphatase PhoE